MRAAAIDFGKVRVGLAVSDELGSMAHPRPFLDGRNVPQLLRNLAQIVEQEGIAVIVVGLPRTLDGRESTAARRVRRFVRQLRGAVSADVQMVDEWLSTREAQARLHEGGHDTRSSRQRVDSAAAAILLQSWLNSHSDVGATAGSD